MAPIVKFLTTWAEFGGHVIRYENKIFISERLFIVAMKRRPNDTLRFLVSSIFSLHITMYLINSFSVHLRSTLSSLWAFSFTLFGNLPLLLYFCIMQAFYFWIFWTSGSVHVNNFFEVLKNCMYRCDAAFAYFCTLQLRFSRLQTLHSLNLYTRES